MGLFNKLEIEDIEFNEDLSLPGDYQDLITQTLILKRDPDLLQTSRSSYILLPDAGFDPISLQRVSSSCLKLKGAGNVTDGLRGKKITPPSEKDFHKTKIDGTTITTIHSGTNEEGNLIPIMQKPRFLGGLEFASAENEYHLTQDAFDEGVNVNIPVAYGKFKFKTANLGFVVLGARDSLDRRVGDFMMIEEFDQASSAIRFPPYLADSMGKDYGAINPRKVLEFFEKLRFKQGKNLNAFHNAGFARHAGYCANYQIDEATKDHVMLDLDSSVRQADLDSRTIFMTRLLDMMSALRGIHEEECSPAVGFLRKYVGSGNPYTKFLTGYFSDVPKKRREKLIKKASNFLHTECTKPFLISSYGEYAPVRNSFSALAIMTVFPLMEAKLEKQGIKPPYDLNRLRTELQDYVEKYRAIGNEKDSIDPFHNQLLQHITTYK